LTPEQLEALRDWLPPFPEGGGVTPEVEAFCRFYRIDFSARYPEVEFRLGAVSSGPHRLAAYRWLQRGATTNLLLLHGYFDHTGLFGRLIEYGLARGCNVLMFDLPGHGLSSGAAAVIDDFGEYDRAIADVLARVPMPELPLWTMAQSTGCAALVEFARHHAWPFAAVVFLAPLVRPAGWLALQLVHGTARRFTDSVTRRFADNSSDREFLEFLRRDPLQSLHIPVRWAGALRRWVAGLVPRDLGVGPALVIQGDADRTVDWQYNLQFIRQLFPGSSVLMVPGGGHHLANEAAGLREMYLARVTGYLALRGLPIKRD